MDDLLSTKLTRSIGPMGDQRHKRKPPPGARIQMTTAWKQKVRDRLAENLRNDVYPRDQVQLAEAIGASDKSTVTKMLRASASKFVPQVCRVLQIAAPMHEHRERDALDEETELLEQAQRDNLAATLRSMRTK